MTNVRHIFKSATTSPQAARDVIAMVLAEEILLPSRTLYLAAPWVTNIVIFDNSTGSFEGLNPEWSRRGIRLIEVLVTIASNNTQLDIRVRPEPHNKPFGKRLRAALKDAGLQDSLQWSEIPDFHTKGLLTDRVWIGGSMNLTERGIGLNAESLVVDFNPQTVSSIRLEFANHGISL
ncbi:MULTISPECIES: phospholipase D-like domain-containing protein DpdK [Pseudomonas]|uniref:phospholipase D-like domain-containing protein DpdK n=1 Tax=Pseudomonas TaxID=286 RepID=UPI0008E23829|nr:MULTISPECIES: phospholipase D-like domain-containing protein DpdK [Pseudomonas]NNB71608.1 hypothetical protein [Pseudomonas fluorescens]SFS26658.1 PLD-like domain-containing protein [Pseudomonas sp. NFACC42-2]